MKLSEHTLDVLRNFSTINPNVVVDTGLTIKTMAEAKNILAIATIEDKFEAPFSLYDLSEFLSVFTMMETIDQPDITIDAQSLIIKAGTSKITYRQADKSILTYPQKDINMPDPEVKISLSDTLLARIRKASSILGHATLFIKGNGKTIDLKVGDAADPTANYFSIENVGATEHEFEFHFLISALKLIAGNYNVEISSRLISRWTHDTKPVTYFIALDKTSSFTK